MTETATTERHSYTHEEVERGLAELARSGNRPKVAAKRLGPPYNDGTLRYWRDVKHPQRYQEWVERVIPEVEGQIVQDFRETMVLAAHVERLALEKTVEQIQAGDLKDASTAARNAATVKGINGDKLLVYTGRPTHITHDLDAAELLRALDDLTVDGTAEEIQEAQIEQRTEPSRGR